MEQAYLYDVFVSYNHADRPWVVSDLLPFLREAGLDVMWDERFTPGVRSDINMERAVEGSRRVLAVLTPAWCASQWTEFEFLLGASGDPSGKLGRVVPLRLEACEPPRRLASLSYVDLTSPGERAGKMQFLLDCLRDGGIAPPAPPRDLSPEPVRGDAIYRGLTALGDLMGEPVARQAVAAYSHQFHEACRQIEILGSYKSVHDLLHRFQREYLEPIAREAQRFPGDEQAQENLLLYEQRLPEILDALRAETERGTFLGDEPVRLHEDLMKAGEAVHAALESSDAERLQRVVRQVDRLLARKPPMIHDRLRDASHALNLVQLTTALRIVCESLSRSGIRSEQVRHLEEGAAELARMDAALTALVFDHDGWQTVDRVLRDIEGDLARSLEALEDSWSDLKKMVEQRYAGCAEEWAVRLKTDGEKLQMSLESRDPVKSRQSFKSYRRKAGDRFYWIDCNLKRQCDELRIVGKPLAATLKALT